MTGRSAAPRSLATICAPLRTSSGSPKISRNRLRLALAEGWLCASKSAVREALPEVKSICNTRRRRTSKLCSELSRISYPNLKGMIPQSGVFELPPTGALRQSVTGRGLVLM